MEEEQGTGCAITDKIIRAARSEYYDGTLLQFVQGEMKDALEDMLLLPTLFGSPEVIKTRVFLAVLLTSKILLSKLSTSRPWGRGEETIGTMAARERALEEGLREFTWADVGHSHVRATLSGHRSRTLSDLPRRPHHLDSTSSRAGQEHDRGLLDIDEAERNFPGPAISPSRSSPEPPPRIDADVHAPEQLTFFW